MRLTDIASSDSEQTQGHNAMVFKNYFDIMNFLTYLLKR